MKVVRLLVRWYIRGIAVVETFVRDKIVSPLLDITRDEYNKSNE